jgi:predicted nucleic acid-binding protein
MGQPEPTGIRRSRRDEGRPVKISVALQGVARLFLDTAPVINYVERHPTFAAVADEVFDRIDAASLHAVTSPITLAECLVAPIRLGLTQVQQNFADLIVSGANVTFIPLDAAVARRAAELRVNYNLTLADALQVAAALAAGCDALLTNDLSLKRVREIPVLVLSELEV